MIYFKKAFFFFSLLCCANAYSSQHVVEFDVANDELQYDMVIAFTYDTTVEKGPGAIIFRQKDRGSYNTLYARNMSGPSISITQASVQYGSLPYLDYTPNASCINLDLQSLDSRGLFITMYVNFMSMSIDCTATKLK